MKGASSSQNCNDKNLRDFDEPTNTDDMAASS